MHKPLHKNIIGSEFLYVLKNVAFLSLLLYSVALFAQSKTETNAHYLDTPTDQLQPMLSDPAQRISSNFQIPEELKPTVFFWFLVYAKYSSYHTLIYDKDRPFYLYDVVEDRKSVV